MQNNKRMRHIIVMGVGNLLLMDDGIGIHAIRKLQEKAPFGNDIDVEIIDCGLTPDITVFVNSYTDKLIIVDAVQAHGRPGSIYRFTPDILEIESKDFKSLHNLNLRESLSMLRMVGLLPEEVIIIGVEPGEIGWGITLTADIEAKLEDLVAILQREITT